jgi:hypothetical protein
MANHLAKGREYMREIARLGGLASGKTRFLKRAERIRGEWACRKHGVARPAKLDWHEAAVRELMIVTRGRFTREEIEQALRPVDKRGGSHDTDWRCPRCHHFNSTKRRACAKCSVPGPANGRLTRRALRAMQKEHQTQGYLRTPRRGAL